MFDPYLTTAGNSYELEAISRHLSDKQKDPVTKVKVSS
jgi:hypothetical protein